MACSPLKRGNCRHTALTNLHSVPKPSSRHLFTSELSSILEILERGQMFFHLWILPTFLVAKHFLLLLWTATEFGPFWNLRAVILIRIEYILLPLINYYFFENWIWASWFYLGSINIYLFIEYSDGCYNFELFSLSLIWRKHFLDTVCTKRRAKCFHIHYLF